MWEQLLCNLGWMIFSFDSLLLWLLRLQLAVCLQLGPERRILS